MTHIGHWIKIPTKQLVFDAQLLAYIIILTKMSWLWLYTFQVSPPLARASDSIHVYQNPCYSKMDKIGQVFNEFIDKVQKYYNI